MSKTNVWYEAICAQLHAERGPLPVDKIWQRLADAGFKHGSKAPRSTLGARIAELVQMKKLDRVGPAMYQLVSEEASS